MEEAAPERMKDMPPETVIHDASATDSWRLRKDTLSPASDASTSLRKQTLASTQPVVSPSDAAPLPLPVCPSAPSASVVRAKEGMVKNALIRTDWPSDTGDGVATVSDRDVDGRTVIPASSDTPARKSTNWPFVETGRPTSYGLNLGVVMTSCPCCPVVVIEASRELAGIGDVSVDRCRRITSKTVGRVAAHAKVVHSD